MVSAYTADPQFNALTIPVIAFCAWVLVVDGDDTVQRHNVELGQRRDDRVLAKNGVQAGERVIVRGLQQVRPGMQVQVKAIPSQAGQG